MAANEKFKKLVDLLYRRTKSGSLDWIAIDGVNSVQVRVADRPIVLTKRESDFEEPVIILSIYDLSANLIDSFTDETLSDLLPYSNETPFIVMEEIFDLALHKAKGIDENLDAILDELDDHVPF